jgi:hypothetical protein
MNMCIICRFDTELDDVVLFGGVRCICLRCYMRETATGRPVPARLRREVSAILTEREPA